MYQERLPPTVTEFALKTVPLEIWINKEDSFALLYVTFGSCSVARVDNLR